MFYSKSTSEWFINKRAIYDYNHIAKARNIHYELVRITDRVRSFYDFGVEL